MKTDPLSTMVYLTERRAAGDTDSALACYTEDAIVMAQPGQPLSGAQSVRQFTINAAALPIVFGKRDVWAADDIALHMVAWTLTVTDEAGSTHDVHGRTTDVLKKDADGRWLIAIDNPWGGA